MRVRWLFAAFFALSLAVHAQGENAPQAIVHMLDYIGVDYAGAVEGGRVKDEGEYKEMVEFSAQVQAQLAALRANASQPELIGQARALSQLIAGRAGAAAVAQAAGRLRWAIIGAYNLTVAPKRAPDLTRGAALYAHSCAGCHGADGRGDGVAARGLDPAPANFHDIERMAGRSIYGLYNTIMLGVTGTAMTGFQSLSNDERWALAFFVANFGVPAPQREQGKALWNAGEARSVFRDFTNVATLSRKEIVARFGEEAALVQDYLLAYPGALARAGPAPLHYARDNLKSALEAYARGEQQHAQSLAVSAYLEGFELVEPALDAADRELRVTIENDMVRLRSLMREGAPVSDVQAQVARLVAGLERADETLTGSVLSPTGAALSAFVILIREGLEAILVLAAIVAFLVKAHRPDALRYIHAGWIAALALGVATWFIATYAVAMSGAGREMTEGVTALVSTAILLYVGWWLHDKSHAHAWKQFIEQRLAGALSKGTIGALASLSFLAVYREVFEMVLFYEALWLQTGEDGHGSIVAGFIAAAAALAVIAWLIFRYGVRLPITLFFTVSAVFLALLAIVFTGQGIGALQEAGTIGATFINAPRIPLLGIFPTVQSLAAQACVCIAVIAVPAWSRISAPGSERR